MKWLSLIAVFLIGCSSEVDIFQPESDCGECGLEIYAMNLTEVSSNHYMMEYDTSLAQTYTTLNAKTQCGWSEHLSWDTDYQYLINTDWVSLVNPGSMTDEEGNAKVIFGTWEDFVGYTVTVYCGYLDDCGVHHVDSLKITIVDEE